MKLYCRNVLLTNNLGKRMKKFSSEIELHGHIIDSLILTKVFDGIMDHGGSFEVLDIIIGKKKKDERYAKLLVIGNNA